MLRRHRRSLLTWIKTRHASAPRMAGMPARYLRQDFLGGLVIVAVAAF
jgi:hypothetical protein